MTVAERLRAEIARRNMNPTRFAAFVQIPQGYISKWVNGKQGISPENAAKLARATKQPIEYYLPTPPDPDAREVLAAALERLDEDGKWAVARYAERIAARQPATPPAPVPARASGQSGRDKRRRARSSGSAPAA